jgi:hypothetical protein
VSYLSLLIEEPERVRALDDDFGGVLPSAFVTGSLVTIRVLLVFNGRDVAEAFVQNHPRC